MAHFGIKFAVASLFDGRERLKRVSAVCVCIAALSALITVALSRSTFFQIIRLKAQDFHFLWRGTVPTRDIVILAIDQKSLDTFPEPRLFWHKYYAAAIQAAAQGGAKVMALDVSFVIPVAKWEPDDDQVLTAALLSVAQTMPVICGFIPSTATTQDKWMVPVNLAASYLGLSAFVNLTVDPDDFVREQELFAGTTNGQPSPAHSLALRAVEKYLGTESSTANEGLVLGGKEIPISADRRMRINFAGPAGTFPRISLSDFVAAARRQDIGQLRTWVQGKIVLVGLDYVEDRFPTPFFPLLGSGKWNTPGVEIHANTIHTLLHGDFLVPAQAWVSFAVIATVALTAAILTLFFPVWQALGLLTAFLLAGLGISQAAFLRGTVLPTLEIPVAALLAFICTSTYRFFAAEKRGQLLRSALNAFVGRVAVREIDSNEAISTTSKRDTVTILFSDISGFTAFCDNKDASDVVRLLNQYFSLMVGIISAHHGQVNKFIGDGILAIFSNDDGAELRGQQLSSHTLRSIRCASAMLEAKSQFKTRIGIYTGSVVIGNIGSAEKLEYTALGDTVNMASRLEALNKELGTQLLMSELTYEGLDQRVKTKHMGAVAIRGVTAPVNVYTLAALQPAELTGAAH